MLIMKNFTRTEPDELLKLYLGSALEGAIYLQDDEGHDWYAHQSKFQKKTIKIAYDTDMVIRQLVDQPNQNGEYDVSLLFPINLSVAEVAADSYPAGVTLSGSWKFNENAKSVYQDEDAVAARILTENTSLRAQYATTAALNISTLQAGIARDRMKTGDSDALISWDNYLCNLRDMTDADLQQSPAPFPEQPATIL